MDEELARNGQATGQDGTSNKAKQQKDTGSSNSNTPRKRVSQACDRCRSRKDKCDGKKPVCSTCASLDQICSYDPATKKRGLPEGYVRGLEKLWGLTIREAAGIEDTVLSILAGGEDDAGLGDLLNVWNDREGSETLLETWRKSRISRELERVLPILDLVEEKPGKRKRPESGLSRADESAGISGPLPRAVGFDRKPSVADPHGDKNDALTWHPSHDPQRRRVIDVIDIPSVPEEGPEVSIVSTDLPSRAWHLLDVFFSYTHCWLPIVEKHDLLRTSYQYSQSGHNASYLLPGSGDHAALWAVLAYADYQHNAIMKKDPEVDTRWTVEGLYSRARSLIPSDEGAFELGHVQALLILTLLNMGRNHWSRAWLLIGQAVRIAINLGLDEASGEKTIFSSSANKKSRNKHVFLGCFALDTLVAARLRRTPQLRKEDVERVGPVEEDALDEWNPWMDCLGVRRGAMEGPHGPVAVLSTFNRLILLLKILNSVTRDVSIGMRRVETCKELLSELDSWGHVLPSLLALSSTKESLRPPLLPHRFHLHLAHMSTIAVVYNHLSASSKGMLVSDLTISQTFAATARQAMWLLMRQSERFGLLIVPPTYEYFATIACEGAFKVQNSIADEQVTYDDWQRNMEGSLANMEKAWPAFEPLKNTFSSKTAAHIYQYQAPSPLSGLQPGLFEIPHPISSHAKHPSISDSIFSFSGGLNAPPVTQGDAPGPSNSTFPPTQHNPLLNLPSPTGLHAVVSNSASWPDHSSGQNLFLDQPSADQIRLPDGSLGSEIDGDSMFNDFATLDAMEWTNNWDQSLLNLGFTDPENMNQDFYAFCREPDPLYSNNLVQQLLSNSNADPRAAFDESGFGFSNPHVEASQILQALSTAHDHGRG